MKPDVDAGQLERRVRRVGKETMPGIRGFCSFYPFGAISGVQLLRLTALDDNWRNNNTIFSPHFS